MAHLEGISGSGGKLLSNILNIHSLLDILAKIWKTNKKRMVSRRRRGENGTTTSD